MIHRITVSCFCSIFLLSILIFSINTDSQLFDEASSAFIVLTETQPNKKEHLLLDNSVYQPNPCFYGDLRYDNFFDSHAVLIVDGQFIPNEHPLVENGIVYVPQCFIDNGSIVSVQEGMKGTIPYIVAVTPKNESTDRAIIFSEETAIMEVIDAFSEVDWGEFLKETYNLSADCFSFTSKGVFGNFWVVDVNNDMFLDEFSYTSIWIDIYTGELFGKDCGYESVYSVSKGIDRVVSALRYQLY